MTGASARRGRGSARVLLAALALVALAPACARPGAPLPAGARAMPPGELTPAFQAMRAALVDAQRLRAAGDEAALHAHVPEVARIGVALLGSTLPHDLARADVPRYMEGRAAFGRALETWVRAHEQQDAQALRRDLDPLVDAFWAWVDISKGLPPEREV